MSLEFIQGNRLMFTRRFYNPLDKTSDWALYFVKAGVQIARVYYHQKAKQLVVQTVADVSLTKETLISIIPFLDKTIFRIQRRRLQAIQRRL